MLLFLSGWNVRGKEKSLPTRLSILHIPNPDQEALRAFDLNMALTLKSEEPFHLFPPSVSPTPDLASNQLCPASLNSYGLLPSKFKTLKQIECEVHRPRSFCSML